jgi:hypothetical protein
MDHLRYFGRAFIAWNHYRTLVGADDADLVEVAGGVGPDETSSSLVEVFDEHRAVEGVEDGLIADTVLSRTIDDPRLCHNYLVQT